MPTTTSAARERRRQVLIGLSVAAFVTLVAAIIVQSTWLIATHVAIDAIIVGYVILLVRHRQLSAERAMKVEPIRPAVTEDAAPKLQVAPSYLVRSGT